MHVATQNLALWLYVMISGQICLEIHCFSDVQTPVMAYGEHCILVQQKLDILVAFTNTVLHQTLGLSSCLRLDWSPCIVIIDSIRMPMSLFCILV